MCTRDDAETANQDNQGQHETQAPIPLKPAQATNEDPQPAETVPHAPHHAPDARNEQFNYPAEPQQPAVVPEKQPEHHPEPQNVPAPTVIEAPASIHQSTASDWHYCAALPALNPAVKERHDKLKDLTQHGLDVHAAKFSTTQGPVQTLNHKAEGNFYQGETWNNIPHGFGKMIMKDGTLFEGYFSEGQPNHFVRVIRPTREVYQGEYANQRPNGKGIRTDPNGATTQCDNWNNGQENGKTIKTDMNGRKVFDGTFKDGKMNGQCSYYSDSEKCAYEGNFLAGSLEGQGKKTYDNGKSYEGAFVRGVENGKGKMVFVDGRKWEGDFTNGRANGTGVFTADDGKTTSNQTWKDGKRA
jgi:hypothetical protein